MIRRLRTWFRKISQPFNPPFCDHANNEAMCEYIYLRLQSHVMSLYDDEIINAYLYGKLPVDIADIIVKPLFSDE